MQPFLVTLPILALALAGCEDVIQGNGAAATETRTVGVFEGAVTNDGIALVLDASGDGEPGTLEITGDENLLPLVITEVKRGWLTVRATKPLSSRIGITVKGPAPGLAKVGANTGGSATATGIDRTGTFEVAVAGGAAVTVDGAADRLDILASGGSSLRARDLVAREVRILSASGGSHVEVCATGALVATASGGAVVIYSCDPERVEPNASGGAVIQPAER